MEPLLENNKIYVQGLPEESTDNALSEYFKKYGRVVKATVAMDGQTGKPKDFGFVWFENEDSAKAAVGDVEEHVILGTKVEVKEAIRRERSPLQDMERENCLNCERTRALRHSKKIFVGGLPSDLTEEEFKSFFERFGRTTDVVIIVDSASRKSRGFGFVTYESEESARAVLRNSRYVIHGKEVEVKVAIPKEVANTTEHPNVHSQHHPSAGANGYHHDSNFQPMGGLPYANSTPIYPYANGMVTTSPAYAYGAATPSPAYANSMVNGFCACNGCARTVSNQSEVALRLFTKIRISKPPSINGENCAGSSSASSSASRAEGSSPASEDSNLDDCPSGCARTVSNRSKVALRPFTKIRISKPPSINGENCAGSSSASSSASRAEGSSPASEDSNLDNCPSGCARTVSNRSKVALRPFTKIRISKPPSINGENCAGSSSASCAEGPSPTSEDSNLDGCPSPSVINNVKDQASSSENGQNDS